MVHGIHDPDEEGGSSGPRQRGRHEEKGEYGVYHVEHASEVRPRSGQLELQSGEQTAFTRINGRSRRSFMVELFVRHAHDSNRVLQRGWSYAVLLTWMVGHDGQHNTYFASPSGLHNRGE